MRAASSPCRRSWSRRCLLSPTSRSRSSLAAMAKKEASAVEVADAHLNKLDEHRALNAFITETPDKAREMAKASDARRARGEAGLLEGVPLAIKDLFCTEGVQTTAGEPHPRRLRAAVREHGDRQPVEGGRHDGRQDQSRRIRHGLVEHDQPFRRRRESVEAQGRQPQARARRLVGRLGGGGRGLHGAGQHRHGHRRLDPPARVVLRHRRHEADLRPLLALGRGRLRKLARPARPVCTHRRGRGTPVAGDVGARSQGLDVGAVAQCRTSPPRRATPTSRA